MREKGEMQLYLLRMLSMGLAVVGLMSPLGPTAAAQQAKASTDASRELLNQLSGLIDDALYDVGELSLVLVLEEPESISDWVAQNISYQTYPGLLRGPQGTLIAKAGNALDQSMLLATLLEDAGFDARIALGSLNDDDAARLVASMFATRPIARASFDVEAVNEALGPGAEAFAEAFAEITSTDVVETDVYQEALVEVARLLKVLGAPEDPDVTEELRAEAKEYAWVEYRLGPDVSWEAAHPAFGGAGPEPVVEAVRYLDSEIPTELTHRLRIEVSIERKRGDEFQVEQIMTPWERPVANLVGVPIVIGNTVMGDVNVGSVEEMRASMAEAAFFAPVLNGSLAPGAQAFDINGNLAPPDVAASAMAGVFQTVGDKLGGAIGALGGMGSDDEVEAPFALTAQYVDFVLVAPGGAEKRYRHTIFDRRDPTDRAEGGDSLLPEAAVLDGVLTVQTVMVSVGTIATDYALAVLLDQAAAQLDVIDRLSAAEADDSELDQGAALLEASSDLSTRDHLQLFGAFDAVTYEGDPLSYRAEPAVVSLFGTLALGADGTSVSGVDIVSNVRRLLHLSGERVERDFPAGVLAGVWDTLMEREFVASRTPDVVDSVPNAGVLTLFDSFEALTASGAVVPPAAHVALQRDLAAGYAVAFTEASSVEEVGWAYWRVDLVTGETLGIGSSGRGVSMAEYLANLQVGLIVSAALSVPSFIMCATSSASWTCYCDVVASGVALPLGLAYLGALAGATGIVFTLLDIAVVGPVTTLWTPPICSSFAIRDSEGVLASRADEGQVTGGATAVGQWGTSRRNTIVFWSPPWQVERATTCT